MDKARLDNLLEGYLKTRDEQMLNVLVEGYEPLCAAIARRFLNRGAELEDLKQVALMGLLKAIERYDGERGLQFITYATPTIAGEIRHYLRDKASAIRFSRDKVSLLAKMNSKREELTLELKREPTLKEMAAAMELPPYDLLQLMQQREASNLVSMDAALSEDEAMALSSRLGQTETGYARVEDRDETDRLMALVTPQEKRLLELRFADSLGQRETAKILGMSQMQVSRMERRVLLRLKGAALQ